MIEHGYLLDASAALAVIFGEPGADRVLALSNDPRICSVNLAEVIAKQHDRSVSARNIALNVIDLGAEVVPFDARMALRSGELRPLTRAFGLSLGDRACLAAAQVMSLTVVTADRAWSNLDIGIKIEVIR